MRHIWLVTYRCKWRNQIGRIEQHPNYVVYVELLGKSCMYYKALWQFVNVMCYSDGPSSFIVLVCISNKKSESWAVTNCSIKISTIYFLFFRTLDHCCCLSRRSSQIIIASSLSVPKVFQARQKQTSHWLPANAGRSNSPEFSIVIICLL